MKRAQLVATCSLILVAASIHAEDLRTDVDRSYPQLETLYRTLHSHPELSGQEVETAKRLAAEARRSGFEVTEHVGGYGVVAVLKNGTGPTVSIRTEEDALPLEETTGLAFASRVRM